MKMAKALVMAAGLALASGAALAQRVDEDDLLGVWDGQVEGDTIRIVMAEGGSYLVVHLTGDAEEPVDTWEVGLWEVDGDEVTFTPIAMSVGDDLTETVVTVEDVDEGVLVLSSDETGEIEFESALDPVVGVWQADTEEGEATFAIACGGGFAGAFEEEDSFWGSWEMDGDEIVFSATEEEWTLDGEPEFEEHEGEVTDVNEDTLTMLVDGLGDDELEWERIAAHPLVGTWTGEPEGEGEITLEIDEEGTFSVSMDGHDEVFSGVWTVVEGGWLVLGMMDGEMGQVESLQFVLTSPGSVMMGPTPEEMAEFTRE
jgi:hypothetical protein